MTSNISLEEVQRIIREEGDAVVDLLLEKNKLYGNSAVSPKRFFSKADGVEQIRVRIDDKLNRLVNGLSEEDEEDVVKDLIGYLILLRVAQRVQEEKTTAKEHQKFFTGGPIGPTPNFVPNGFCECKTVNFGFRHLRGPGCV